MQKVTFEGHTYTISFAAMPKSLQEQLNAEELKTYLALLQAVQEKPKVVYAEVRAFAEQHANIPEVTNLLTFAHIQNHKVVEAENLIKETYQRHPDYLFAKINYADQCIRKRMLAKVEEIFPTFSLRELCKGKEIFHTSEFRGFLIMMAYYYLAKKERSKAIPYFDKAKEIEPSHPSVLYLEKKLFKRSLLSRLLRKKQRN